MFRIEGSGAIRSIGAQVPAGSAALSMHPSNQVLYAVQSGTNLIPGTIDAFSIDVDTGEIAAFGSAVPTELLPQAMQVHPSGTFAYVANVRSSTISIYDIDSQGQLSSPRTTPIGPNLTGLAMDPNGEFLYLTRPNGSNLRCYSIAGTGALNLVNDITPSLAPTGLAVSPSGSFVYAADPIWNVVSVHAVDPGLGLGEGIAIDAGEGSRLVAVERSGRFAYVGNSRDISAFAIDPETGLLSSPVTTSINGELTALALDPSGQVLLAANRTDNSIAMFSIDQVTGVLRPLGTPVGAGASPVQVSIVSFPD